ncbi:MAG: hypothetical protein HYY30_13830 [Chloroflexi bacterium]|nr:hypothetical protein [Chloroflexota bacterium]
MTPHQYLHSVLANQQMRQADIDTLRRLRGEIEAALRRVYGSAPRFYYGGSYGKDTMIQAAFDLDIVMYFPSTDTRALRTIYNGVHQTLTTAGYTVRPKTVALRLPYNGGFHIDVIPGRAQDTSYRYATLYKNGEDTTLQTSIQIHIDSVRDSGAREIIKLSKLWRVRYSLPWETFPLEQIVIVALRGHRKDDYGSALWTVFQFLRDNILTIRVIDPANSNNVITISTATRGAIRQAALNALAAANWGQIIW